MKERDAEIVRAYARIEAMFELGTDLVRRARIEKAALERRLELERYQEACVTLSQEARVSRDPDDGP